MPEHALRAVTVDHRVPLRDIAPLLVQLTAEPIAETAEATSRRNVEIEVEIAREQDPLRAGVEGLGAPSALEKRANAMRDMLHAQTPLVNEAVR